MFKGRISMNAAVYACFISPILRVLLAVRYVTRHNLYLCPFWLVEIL